MIRVMFERNTVDNISGLNLIRYYSLEFECPEIEAELKRGGSGENGSEFSNLLAVELIDPEKSNSRESSLSLNVEGK